MKQSYLIVKKKAPIRWKRFFLAIFGAVLLLGAAFQNDIRTVLADENLWQTVNNQEMLGRVGQDVYGTTQPQDIRFIVAKVIQVFLTFLALIFIILLILAGYKYLMARGDETKVQEATHQILHAVIGLVIILASYAITHFVFNILNNNVIKR